MMNKEMNMLNAPLMPVLTKARKRHGMVYAASETGYHVRIEGKGAKAQIDVLKTNDTTKQVEFCKTFKVGDVAEHDSYNFSYTGKIVSITDKTVTISNHVNDAPGGRVTRLDLHTFCWRNHDFDLAVTTARNIETSYNI
jgi:hypothetical protein